MSPTVDQLVADGLLPSSAIDFFTATIYVGLVLSCFVSGANRFGWCGMLMASAVLLIVSWLLIVGQWGCVSLLAVVFKTFGIYVAEMVAAGHRGS